MKVKVGDYIETKGMKGQVQKVDSKYAYIYSYGVLKEFSSYIGIPLTSITKHIPFKSYEVMWYEGNSEEEALNDDYHTREFVSKREAMKFYDTHCVDENKYNWSVTKRDLNWQVVDDLI